MKLIVKTLIDICVRVSPSEGGIAWNLGENGALSIRVTPYRPNVQCKAPGTGPPPGLCRKILDQMPTDGIQRRFGPPSDRTVEVPLPRKFTTPEIRCALAVNTISSTDVSDWYKLWAASIAVEVMCVEARGAGGFGLGLGGSSSLDSFAGRIRR